MCWLGTGDLGEIGRTILLDFMKNKGRDLSQIHMDCGIEIYDKDQQDTHAGGSGCGCSAVTLCSYILPRVQDGTWKRVLFVPTGALLSTVSFNEGQSIPRFLQSAAKILNNTSGNISFAVLMIVSAVISSEMGS